MSEPKVHSGAPGVLCEYSGKLVDAALTEEHPRTRIPHVTCRGCGRLLPALRSSTSPYTVRLPKHGKERRRLDADALHRIT